MPGTINLLFRDNKGVTSLEYAVLAAIIVVGLAAMLPAVKTTLNTVFTSVATAV